MRTLLAILLAVLALNAFGGGYYGMSGAPNVPVEWLRGTMFRDYFWPSVFLFFVVGGACSAASVLVWLRKRSALAWALGTGLLLLGWIVVQVAIIGYVSWMQPAVAIAAIVIIVLAAMLGKGSKDLNQRS